MPVGKVSSFLHEQKALQLAKGEGKVALSPPTYTWLFEFSVNYNDCVPSLRACTQGE